MKLPGDLGELDFGKWAYGLLAAFIGGGAGAFSGGLAAIIVDPKDFNIFTAKFWTLVAATFVISGLAPFFAYLHGNPLPAVVKKVETMTQTTTQGTMDPKVVETVKVTTVEPVTSATITKDQGKDL